MQSNDVESDLRLLLGAFTQMSVLRRFLGCTRGQDLLEYVLILALVVLATTAALFTAGEALSAVWNTPVLERQGSGASTDQSKH
jgi:Flp pilus assembly pilin Flp